MNTRLRRYPVLIATAAIVGTLGLSGCSSEGSGDSRSDGSSRTGSLSPGSAFTDGDDHLDQESGRDPEAPATEAPRAESAPSEGDVAEDEASGEEDPGVTQVSDPDTAGRAVISTGTVSLRSEDVARTRFDVQKAVDTMGGTIGDEQTTTDKEGTVTTSRMVLRVPSAKFDEAMAELGDLADLVRTTRTSEDVSTEVIDNDVRIRAQEKSLERIEALLARAEDIGEIVRIESELTRRQGTLDSLKARQAWLKDQTSMSTITLHVESQAVAEPEESDDRNPFLAGLLAGLGALGATGAVLAEVSGALLPFTVLLLGLGVVARFGWRRVRRAGGSEQTPSAA